MPLGLVVATIEQNALMGAQVFGLCGQGSALEVRRRSDKIADAPPDPFRDEARIPKLPEPDGHIDIVCDEIDEQVGDEEIDLDARVRLVRAASISRILWEGVVSAGTGGTVLRP
jgi:hypothetical protein